ncbi:MAG: class I SAM-dependent methyltransferase [Chloroflexi bacterium]|nr:class I SAM-dependent methyltransferase [Chloroflexota bacterium]
MQPEIKNDRPPICDYEGSDYQQRFWDRGEREYEDQVEAIAIKRLLPKDGKLLLEIGAGAGRNTPRYGGFDRIVLMDYSTTQLEQAQQKLGIGDRYIYVAADVYKLPFVDGLFDTATMIRVIHHMADAPKALKQIRQVMQPGGKFLLEYANKRNLKAILRYWLGQQEWNPFDKAPVEFVPLNFDFHPKAMAAWLREANFAIERQITVSHFRMGWAKRSLPLKLLVSLDAALQPTGALWQFTPSIFLRAQANGDTPRAGAGVFFKCPECGTALPKEQREQLACPGCGRRWGMKKGIYNFKESLKN